MNAPAKIVATPTGLIADASKVSPQEFLAVAMDRLFPAPKSTALSEKAEASRRFISAAWVSSDVPALRAAYLRELDAIDAKYRACADDLEPIVDAVPVVDGDRGSLWL